MKVIFIILLIGCWCNIMGQAPKSNAGFPITIQLPTTTTNLSGTATGTYTTVAWTCVVDPTQGGVSIASASTLSTGISGLSIWGNYVFKLVLSGGSGSDSSYVRVNVLPACNNGTKHRYNLTASGGGIYVPNARTQPWLGGDTLVLPAGFLNSDIIFGGFNQPDGLSGDPCNPIIIMGPDAGIDSSNIIRFDDHCQYIKIIDNPINPGSIATYTVGMALCNNFDFAHIRINGKQIAGQGATGIICKRHIDTLGNGAIVPETIYPNYSMVNIHFHDFTIKNTDGEGMYIGSTAPMGGDGQGPDGFYPVLLDSVEIGPNVVLDSTGWDGIQLSGATNGCSIHNDKVTHYGLANMGSQQAGIIAGGITNTNVYSDTIINGTGNGLQLFGYGISANHDIILDSCGRDGTGSGQATIFQDDIPDTVHNKTIPSFTVALQQSDLYNIFIKHPQTFGAIRIQNDRGSALKSTLYNDGFCIPGANPATWQSIYLNTFPVAIQSGLTLTCTFPQIAGPFPKGSKTKIH